MEDPLLPWLALADPPQLGLCTGRRRCQEQASPLPEPASSGGGRLWGRASISHRPEPGKGVNILSV